MKKTKFYPAPDNQRRKMQEKQPKCPCCSVDGYVCGRHVGGCLKPLSEDEANLDHIIPKAFLSC